MPTIKIADLPTRPCRHPEHSPPGMRVFAPGVYQHTCPGCGASMVFTVERPMLQMPKTQQTQWQQPWKRR